MRSTVAAAAPGADQPAAPAAKIKTASHTKFLRVPSAIDCSTVLGRVKGALASLGGVAALDAACAPCAFAFAGGRLASLQHNGPCALR